MDTGDELTNTVKLSSHRQTLKPSSLLSQPTKYDEMLKSVDMQQVLKPQNQRDASKLIQQQVDKSIDNQQTDQIASNSIICSYEQIAFDSTVGASLIGTNPNEQRFLENIEYEFQNDENPVILSNVPIPTTEPTMPVNQMPVLSVSDVAQLVDYLRQNTSNTECK